MSSDRKKYVMAVELAIQREIAYRKKLESSHPEPNMEFGKNPFSQNHTPLPTLGLDPSLNLRALVPSLRPEQSLHGSHVARTNPSPSSSPGRGLRSSPCPAPSPKSPVTSPAPSNPFQRLGGPSRPPKPILSLQGPNARLMRPIFPLQGLLPRPKSSPLGLSPLARPISLPSPHPGSMPKPTSGQIILIRKGAPHQPNHGDDDGDGGKKKKFFCKVCEVRCSSALNLKMHLQGQKHEAKMNQIQGVGKSNARVYCELCRIWCMNDFNYKQHLSGKNHTLKLHAAKIQEQMRA